MHDLVGDRKIPATGVTLKALEFATGKKPTVCGKPSKALYDVLVREHGI